MGMSIVLLPYSVISAVGVILAAVYLLWAYQRAFTGPAGGENATLRDLKARELTAVVPLLALSLFLGIYPKPVIDRVEPSVRPVICGVERGSDYRDPAGPTRPPAVKRAAYAA